MIELFWTDSAIRDLEDIEEFISRDSIKYAQITTARLIQRTDILLTYPLTGRKVPDKRR
ncbi:MAG: type II toxin-antitoxin system RelE/ParE family toxin [Fulvivirga sp.]|uniref:type II toxin-antitoxin system RelE/ParE family toxin n=1 Tax=Fulvivirga sp. TaxID=1931237 RepID=UPI0032F61340